MRPLVLLVMMALLAHSHAQDTKEEKGDLPSELLKQKTFLESAKKDFFPKAIVQETKNLWVVSLLPAEKSKSLADTLEKQFTLANTALKIEDVDKNWMGKLGVLLFPERSDYTQFMVKVDKRGLPDSGESSFIQNSGTMAYVAVTMGRGQVGVDLERKAAIELAASMLARKAGGKPQFPSWLSDGFGRAVLYRAFPQKYAAERATMRKLARARSSSEIWGEEWKDDTYLLSVGFVDYLAFGPEKAKFADFIKSFIPGEGNEKPTVTQAFENAMIDEKMVENAWKRWMLSSR